LSMHRALRRVSLAISLIAFSNDPATTESYTLSLHDALPICSLARKVARRRAHPHRSRQGLHVWHGARRSMSAKPPSRLGLVRARDRKSTRLNSSHVKISYAVFCLKKKTDSPLIVVEPLSWLQ